MGTWSSVAEQKGRQYCGLNMAVVKKWLSHGGKGRTGVPNRDRAGGRSERHGTSGRAIPNARAVAMCAGSLRIVRKFAGGAG